MLYFSFNTYITIFLWYMKTVCYDMWRQYVSMRYHPCKNSIAIREGRVKLNFNYTFHTRKWIWIWLLYKKGVHFCSGLDLLTVVPVHQTITRFETPRTVHLSHLICFFYGLYLPVAVVDTPRFALTYWAETNGSALQTTFWMHLHEWNSPNFNWKFTRIYS